MLHLPDEFLEAVSRAVASLFTSACFPIVRRDVWHPRVDDAADVDVTITLPSCIQQFCDAFQFVQRANQRLMGFHVVFWNLSFPADAVDGRLEWVDARVEHLVQAFPQGAVDAAHIVRLDDELLTVDDFLRWIREDVGQFSHFVNFVQLDVGGGIFKFGFGNDIVDRLEVSIRFSWTCCAHFPQSHVLCSDAGVVGDRVVDEGDRVHPLGEGLRMREAVSRGVTSGLTSLICRRRRRWGRRLPRLPSVDALESFVVEDVVDQGALTPACVA